MPPPEIPAIVETIATAWNCDPVSIGSGPRSELHLSILQSDGREAQEASASLDYHTLCFPLRHYVSEVILDGRASAAVAVSPGDLCLVPAARRPWGVNHGPWRSLHAYLPIRLITDVLRAEELDLTGTAVDLGGAAGFRDAEIERICRSLATELTGQQAFGRLRIDALSQDLAIQLLRCRAPQIGRRLVAPRGGLAPWQIKRVCDAMEACLDGSVSLADLAATVGYSATHLSRAFRRSTGVTPFAWLHRLRIRRAEVLLSDPTLPLVAVALAVGFSAQSHFTTAFLRETGTTPGAWRRERLR